ncbi:MAG: FHA domain-containing protein [Muribaculaceae bacterium]|nr:FHA domain-containing protein [Muribaculaceae bacterium]
MDQESMNNSAPPKLKTVVCEHCGKNLTVSVPSKPGRYKITCPQCSNKVPFEVQGERKVLKSDILDNRVISHSKPKGLKPAMPPIDAAKQPKGNAITPPTPGNIKNDKVNIPVLGTPVMTPGKNYYQIMNLAQANKQYRFECPGCHKDIVIMPRFANKLMKVKCSVCGTEVLYRSAVDASVAKVGSQQLPPEVNNKPVQQSASQPDDSGPHTVFLNSGGMGGYSKSGKGGNAGYIGGYPGQYPAGSLAHPPVSAVGGPQSMVKVPLPGPTPSGNGIVVTHTEPKGMLCWKTGTVVRRTKTYRLLRGRTTVGRYDTDPEKRSDVMIRGDDEMSRRSVEINVVQKPGVHDYIYEFRLLRATNTVYVNGRPVDNGLTIQLNYGDTIRMGKTNITFVKVNDDWK